MNAVGYEFQALRTLRFARLILALAIVGTVLGATVMAFVMSRSPIVALDSDATVALLLRTNVVLPVATAVLAAEVMNGDLRRGLVLAALLRAGGRSRLWVSRAAVATAVGAILGAVAVVLTVAVVTVVAGPVSWEGIVAVGPGVIVVGMGWATFAYGVASMVHRPLAAAAIPILVAYVIEPVLRSTLVAGPPFSQLLAQHLPFGAGSALVIEPGGAGDLFVQSATPWGGNAGIFLGTAALVAASGLFVFRRADLDPVAG